MSLITGSWHEEGRQDAETYFEMDMSAKAGKPQDYCAGFHERWAELEQSALMRHRVFESLDNAVASGYELSSLPPGKIADDLHEYDADLEGVSGLEPHIAAWQESKRA
jgi:hypothetical protein